MISTDSKQQKKYSHCYIIGTKSLTFRFYNVWDSISTPSRGSFFELAAAAALFICLTLFVQEENNLAWQFPFYCSICQNEGFFSF